MDNFVTFKTGLKSEWQALKNAGKLDPLALYFCVDTHEIYRGSILFGTSRIENLTQGQDNDSIVEFYGGSATEVLKGVE